MKIRKISDYRDIMKLEKSLDHWEQIADDLTARKRALKMELFDIEQKIKKAEDNALIVQDRIDILRRT